MKKKIRIVFLIVIVALILFLIAIIALNVINKKGDASGFNVSLEQNSKWINICKDNVDCDISGSLEYEYIKIKGGNSKLKKVVNKFNNKIDKLYNKSLSSNTDSEECSNVSNMYQHSISYDVDSYLYKSDSLISIYVEITEINFCTVEGKKIKPLIYIYNPNKDKVLSKNDLKKIYSVSEKKIQSLIKNTFINLSSYSSTTVNIPDSYDYYLYVDYSGDLVAVHDDFLGYGYAHTTIKGASEEE